MARNLRDDWARMFASAAAEAAERGELILAMMILEWLGGRSLDDLLCPGCVRPKAACCCHPPAPPRSHLCD